MDDHSKFKVGDWVRLCVGTLHGKIVATRFSNGAGGRTMYHVWLPMPPRDKYGDFTAEQLTKVPPGIPYEQTAEAAGVDLTLDPDDLLTCFGFGDGEVPWSLLEPFDETQTVDATSEIKVGDWVRDRLSKLHSKVTEVRVGAAAGGVTMYRVWTPQVPLARYGYFAAEDLVKVPPGVPFEQTPEAASDDMKLDPDAILASFDFERERR